MSMLDRIVGTRRATEGNGHLAVEAGLITDAAQLASGRPTPWQTVQTARNIKRPHALDIIGRVFDHFQELHGDRRRPPGHRRRSAEGLVDRGEHPS